MTLKVVIKNEGNQPGDLLMIRGAKVSVVKGKDGIYSAWKDSDGRSWLQLTGNFDDKVTITQGQEYCFNPNCEYFADFQTIQLKGKH